MVISVWILITIMWIIIASKVPFIRIGVMLIIKVIKIILLILPWVGKVASDCVDNESQKCNSYYTQNDINKYFSCIVKNKLPSIWSNLYLLLLL